MSIPTWFAVLFELSRLPMIGYACCCALYWTIRLALRHERLRQLNLYDEPVMVKHKGQWVVQLPNGERLVDYEAWVAECKAERDAS